MDWNAWKGAMRGRDCLVFGDGPSTHDLASRQWFGGFWRIACNRAVRVIDPDFAVCVEPPRRDRELWREILDAGAVATFTKQDMAAKWWPGVVLIENGLARSQQRVIDDFRTWVGPEPRQFGGEHLKAQMSPAWAVGVAAHLGFETVGLVGVDLTGDRWGDLSRWEERWAELVKLCAAAGTRVIQCSAASNLKAVPFVPNPFDEIRRRRCPRD